MKLFLVRHGIAEEKAATDGWRMLTRKGRRRFHKTAREFGRSQRVDAILTSPLVRALQTAEILAEHVDYREMRVLEELASGHAAREMLAAVAKAAGRSASVALVGHDPQLTDALAELAHVAASRLDFRKGAIVCLEVSGLPQPKAVDARWWLKPRSGSKKKGLPMKPAEAKAKKAAAKKAGPAAKKAAAKKAAAPKKKAAPPSRKAAPAKKPAPPPPAAAPSRQTFMGSPRPPAPPPASPPPPAATEEQQ